MKLDADVCNLEDINKPMLVGTCKASVLRPGDRVYFSVSQYPNFVCGTATVDRVEMFGKSLDEITVNDRAGVYLKDFKVEQGAEDWLDCYQKYSLLTGIGINGDNVLIRLPEDFDEKLEEWIIEKTNAYRNEQSLPTRDK